MGLEDKQLVLCRQYAVESLQIHALGKHCTLGVTPGGHIDKHLVITFASLNHIKCLLRLIPLYETDAFLFCYGKYTVTRVTQLQAT